MSADIGVIGLAVMGQNLILNMDDHGFKVLAYNRTASKVDDFMSGPAKDTNIKGAYSIDELVAGLSKPRRIMLMVRAGEVVDQFIEQLKGHLETGDIIIDGGNSKFDDTSRREAMLAEQGIHYIGAGVSGGEEGARFGPSIMPGGSSEAWPYVKPIFQAIAAKTDSGEACCDWVGSGGSGHFVKMVHNGIEYGDMQLIAESYHFMKMALGLTHDQMKSVMQAWNQSELDSYLIEITADILGYRDGDKVLLESILDAAGQKGTGKWTGIMALDLGMPLTLITESVYARCLSSLKEERVRASKLFDQPEIDQIENKEAWVDALKYALLGAKIISYAQGFMLMRTASDEQNWELNYGNVALLWRGGCIIRSAFLENIRDAYIEEPDLFFLGENTYFNNLLKQCLSGWRKICSKAIELGIPMPCITAGLNFLDGYRSETLPANLIQAQRDYFGAHTYERVDRPRGEYFHTNWTGSGGDTSSTNYDV